MARKTKEVTIEGEGRDQGKVFILTEMSATATESWAIRAMGAMSRSGMEIPEEAPAGGMAAFSAIGLKAFMAAPYHETQPLLAEMMDCVKIKEALTPDGRRITPDDIEELSTIAKLRDEVFELHTGFSLAATLLRAAAEAQARVLASSTTETSSEPSEPSSAES